MQLFLILALLLYGKKSSALNVLNEVKPILESFGGEEIKNALKSAEEISEMLSAVKELTSQPAQPENSAHSTGANEAKSEVSFPLAPISNVANKEITYSLSKFVN